MTRDWICVLAGPLAWFMAHVASWMLAPGAHETAGLTGLYTVDGSAGRGCRRRSGIGRTGA
jgi:hypothetical protein